MQYNSEPLQPYEAVQPVYDPNRLKAEMPENWGVVAGYEHIPVGDVEDRRNDSGRSIADKMTERYDDRWGYMQNAGSSVDVAIIAELVKESEPNVLANWLARHAFRKPR